MAQQQSPRTTAKIIWAALMLGVTMFLAIAVYLVFGVRGGSVVGAPPADPALLVGASGAISVATVAASWLWAVRMKPSASPPPARAGAIPPGPEATAVARLVMAGAMCEFGALVAVVVLMVTGEAAALAPYALSWLALAAHFPGDRRWAQLTGTPEGAARNPMIRG